LEDDLEGAGVTQPMPIDERILQNVNARLETVRLDEGDPFVDRNRHDEVPSYPALVLQDGDEVCDEESMVVQHHRTIAVEGFVQVEAKEDLGPALSILRSEVIKVLQADLSLGGLAINVTLGEHAENKAPVDDSKWIGDFSQKFDIFFWTKHGDPYALAP
jgi:hypothetical protein